METRGESSESDLRERRVHMCMEEIERRVREHGPWTMRTTHCMLTRVWPVLPHIEPIFLRSFTVKLRYSQHVCVCFTGISLHTQSHTLIGSHCVCAWCHLCCVWLVPRFRKARKAHRTHRACADSSLHRKGINTLGRAYALGDDSLGCGDQLPHALDQGVLQRIWNLLFYARAICSPGAG